MSYGSSHSRLIIPGILHIPTSRHQLGQGFSLLIVFCGNQQAFDAGGVVSVIQ